MTDTDLISALRDCYAPGQSQNVVVAGLLVSATLVLDPDAPGAGIPGNPTRYLAKITLYASSGDEAAMAQLEAQVKNRLLGQPAISGVDLQLLPPLFPIL